MKLTIAALFSVLTASSFSEYQIKDKDPLYFSPDKIGQSSPKYFTDWMYLLNVSWTEIDEASTQRGYRYFDVELNDGVARDGSPKLDCLLVKNEGTYFVDPQSVLLKRYFNTPLPEAEFSQGWRVKDFVRYEASGKLNYISIIVKGDPESAENRFLKNQTQEELNALSNQNYRIIDFQEYMQDNEYRYDVLVTKSGSTEWGVVFGKTEAEVRAFLSDNVSFDFKYPVSIRRRTDGTYTFVYIKNTGTPRYKWITAQDGLRLPEDVLLRHGIQSQPYNMVKGAQAESGGYRIYGMQRYRQFIGPERKDAYVNDPLKAPTEIQASPEAVRYDLLLVDNGVPQYPISRAPSQTLQMDQNLKSLEVQLMEKMKEEGTPALSVAIMRKEKLLYSAAFGYADLKKGNEGGQASFSNIGRVGSLSKIFTSLLILKLAEQNYFNLDDHVFGDAGILKIKPISFKNGAGLKTPFLENVTVRNLLEHTGGWDRGHSPDPENPDGCKDDYCDPTNEYGTVRRIVNHLKDAGEIPAEELRSATCTEVIRYMTAPDQARYHQSYAPGTQYAYSNFGYCILAKIIEQATGKTYEDALGVFVQALDVDVAVGRSEPWKRLASEWKAYGVPSSETYRNVAWYDGLLPSNMSVGEPYQVPLLSMVGSGSTLASATGLARIAQFLMGFGGELISSKMRSEALKRPGYVAPNEMNYYGKGVFVERLDVNDSQKMRFYHGGSVAGGQATFMGWTQDGVSAAWHYNAKSQLNGKVEAWIRYYIENQLPKAPIEEIKAY